MPRDIPRQRGSGAALSLALLAALSLRCNLLVSFSDCSSDADCNPGEVCNPTRRYCEVPVAELCNGVDDDRDGVSDDDELFGVCEPGGATTPGTCRDGVLRCRAGARLECVRRAAPTAENCHDGIDNDCNGIVDDSPTCVQNYPATMNLRVGSDDPTYGEGDDAPEHRVCLAPFTLDRYEVSTRAFSNWLSTLDQTKLRVRAPAAPINGSVSYGTYLVYLDAAGEVPLAAMNAPNSPYAIRRTPTGWEPASDAAANLPAAFVTWLAADRYCRWAGKHLPTEAEWFRAVKGGDVDNPRTFPWGNEPPTCDRANIAVDSTGRDCGRRPVAVDALPMGANPERVFNLYGNANEWMWDWLDDNPNHTRNNYYASMAPDAWCAALPDGPLGPSMGSPIAGDNDAGLRCAQCRFLRGRNYETVDVRVGIRRWLDPDRGEAVGGFRCSSGGAAR